jgi:putative endonuclease
MRRETAGLKARNAARESVWHKGEDAACAYFRSLGFTVVDRNFRAPGGELDLIARRRRLLVFCEVKARTSTRYGAPAEAVDPRKAARIRRCAAVWLKERCPARVDVRFDVVSVIVSADRVDITHIPAAF